MSMTRNRGAARARAIAAPLLALLAFAGCAKGVQGTFLPNARPVVTLTHAPASPTNRFFYAYQFKWFGYDPDGAVDHFIYAVDPPTATNAETTWTSTRRFDVTLEFSADTQDSIGPATRSIGYHAFVIKAVDERGLASVPEVRSFFSSTLAPSVQIVSPLPTALAVVRVAPTVRISWEGFDVDGVESKQPVKYKWLLLSASSEFPISAALLDPDSLRRYYAPDFAGWDSTDAETRSVQLFNLTPGATYLFAVIAYDEAGAYSPIFSLSSNLLRFRADLATTLGPTITMWNNFFSFTYPGGGYSLDPSREVGLDLLPGKSTYIRWSAQPGPGAGLHSYRWKLDGDVSDETPRSNDQDVYHWSVPSLLTSRADLGPFGSGETHRFYLEVEDDNGNRSLGIVRFNVLSFEAQFNRDLLIVDDTRLIADQLAAGGCVKPPIGTWPTAAELDTFLYARGGFPWRCYPTGTVSPPGLFAAYNFDTIGTRPEVFPFATLAKYRHVIWLIDPRSALNGGSVFGGDGDVTSLRRMCDRVSINTLAAYVEQGGQLWLVGGGAGYASSIAFGRTSTSGGTLFTLRPGMFMYDFTHWRTQLRTGTVLPFMTRSPHVPVSDPHAPSYARLPAAIGIRSLATDPFPPGRAGQSLSVFYKSVYDIEYMSSGSTVVEPDPNDPGVQVAVLDTLYRVSGIGLPTPVQNPENVIMTSYRGAESGHVMFTGFELWNYRRTDVQALVDAILTDVWGLAPHAPLTHALSPSTAPLPPASAAPQGSGRGRPDQRIRTTRRTASPNGESRRTK